MAKKWSAKAEGLLATKSVRKKAIAPPETTAAASANATRMRLSMKAAQFGFASPAR